MKFRVILEAIFSDGTDDKVGIYTYSTEADALKGFHQYMANYIGSGNVSQVNVIIKNSNGFILKNETWINNSTSTSEEA